MSEESVKAYSNFDTVKILVVTAPNGYASLKSLLSQAQQAKLGGRPVLRVMIEAVSANINVADNDNPGTDVLVIGTGETPVDIKAINALDQIFVDDGAGTATITLLVYLG